MTAGSMPASTGAPQQPYALVHRARAVVAALGVVLVLIALVKLMSAVGTVGALPEVEWGEALIHDHASRIVRGEALYQPPGQTFFSVPTYTPLYYYVVAGLQAAWGIGFAPGRIVSLLAALAMAALIAQVVRRRTGSGYAGAFAGALFLALGIPGIPPWSGLYKESMLGVVLSFAAIAALASGTSARWVVLSAVLGSLAFLTKQTMVIAGAAGFLWLLSQDRRMALLFSVTGIVVVGAVSLWMELSTGYFFTSTIIANVNPFRAELFLDGALGVARLFGGIAFAAVLYIFARGRRALRELNDPVVCYWATSAFLVLATIGKMGSNPNHWMAFAAASSVLATIGIWRFLGPSPDALGSRRIGWALVVSLLLNIVVTGRFIGASTAHAFGLTTSDPRAPALAELVERVRQEPTQVLADPPDVITLAGRPILTEAWAMSLAYNERIWPWDERPLVQAICSGYIGLLVLGYPLASGGPRFGVPRWPTPALEALQDAMTLDKETAGRYSYVHRVPRPGGACASAAN